MKILAFDVSSTALGAAALECGGPRPELFWFDLHRPAASWPVLRRIETIAGVAVQLAELHGYPEVVMEWQGPYRAGRRPDVQGLAVLGQAQGAVWADLRRRTTVHTVGEREWTLQDGKQVSKKQRAAQARLLCPEYDEQVRKSQGTYDPGLDVADAIGLAFWFWTMRVNMHPDAVNAPGRIVAARPPRGQASPFECV